MPQNLDPSKLCPYGKGNVEGMPLHDRLDLML
jgi:hypothetical protein